MGPIIEAFDLIAKVREVIEANIICSFLVDIIKATFKAIENNQKQINFKIRRSLFSSIHYSYILQRLPGLNSSVENSPPKVREVEMQ